MTTKDAILKRFERFFLELTDDRLWKNGKPVVNGVMYVTQYNGLKSFLLSSLDEVERETYKTGVNNALELISACYSPQSGNYNEEVQKDITRAREILLSPSSEKLPKEEEK